MNLCIDQGNSFLKAAVFDGYVLKESYLFSTHMSGQIEQIIRKYPIQQAIVSSVSGVEAEVVLKNTLPHVMVLNATTPVPITNLYKTPESLGNDRLAGVVGASWLMPNTDLLVVDAGTAITYDFIDATQTYRGGNIAPGLEMRMRSLHLNTQKLPLVQVVDDIPFLGTDTQSAIQAGAVYGVVLEIDGYIDRLLLKYPKLCTFLTGGSTKHFDKRLKNRIFADKNLVLIGLNRILQYNAL